MHDGGLLAGDDRGQPLQPAPAHVPRAQDVVGRPGRQILLVVDLLGFEEAQHASEALGQAAHQLEELALGAPLAQARSYEKNLAPCLAHLLAAVDETITVSVQKSSNPSLIARLCPQPKTSTGGRRGPRPGLKPEAL